MSTKPIVAHTDKYDLRIYEQNGKYVVSHSVNNGNIGAGMSTFDTPEEANAYLQSLGADESVFFDTAEKGGLPGGKYTETMGDVGKLLTQNSILDLLTDGAYSDKVGEVFEKGSRMSLINILENADNLPGSAYTDAVKDTAAALTQHSLLNWITDGKYSEKVSEAAEQISKFSVINLVSNWLG